MKIYLKEVIKELKNLKLKNTEELKIKYIKILKNMGVLNIKWCNTSLFINPEYCTRLLKYNKYNINGIV